MISRFPNALTIAGAALLVLSVGTARAETLTLSGSSAGLGTLRLLAAEFIRQSPATQVTVVSRTGSSGGIKAVIAGAADVVVSARPLKADEAAAGAVAAEYGKTPFIFITNAPQAGFKSLSDAAAIIAARRTAWEDGTPIRVIMQHETDTDTALLASLSPELKEALRAHFTRQGAMIAASDDEASTAVERSPGALATSTLAHVITYGRKVHPVPIGGVAPSVQSLADGSYPYAKTLYLVWNTSVSAPARRFLEFAASPAGRQVVRSTGHWVTEPPSGR